MTAIRQTDSVLRDQIKSDEYNEVNSKYAEIYQFIGNLESDTINKRFRERYACRSRKRLIM